NAVGWLKNHREEASLFGTMAQHRVLYRLPGNVVAKDEVFVRDRRVFFETQTRAVNVRTLYVDGVRLRCEIVDDQPGIECYVERDVVAASHSGWRRIGSDARCIRDAIGVGRITAATASMVASL